MNSAIQPSASQQFAIFRRGLAWVACVMCVLPPAAALLAFANTSAAGRQETSDVQARGMFLDSRPTSNTAKPRNPAGKPGNLGLGYTLFAEQDGATKRVSPDHIFYSGDRVRILVETNRDVYLYVFHQEGNGPADLLFPDARLQGGENSVAAHLPSFVPRGRWFRFDEKPGDERLTFVASEKPLQGVPRGAELRTAGTFQMDADALARLVAKSLPALTDAQADEGKPATPSETPSEGARGLALSMNDPPPSRLVINRTTTQSGWITAQVVLMHR